MAFSDPYSAQLKNNAFSLSRRNDQVALSENWLARNRKKSFKIPLLVKKVVKPHFHMPSPSLNSHQVIINRSVMEYMYTVYPNVRHSHITLVGQDQSHQFAISMNIPRNKPHDISHDIWYDIPPFCWFYHVYPHAIVNEPSTHILW